jgi:hypothetical protein
MQHFLTCHRGLLCLGHVLFLSRRFKDFGGKKRDNSPIFFKNGKDHLIHECRCYFHHTDTHIFVFSLDLTLSIHNKQIPHNKQLPPLERTCPSYTRLMHLRVYDSRRVYIVSTEKALTNLSGQDYSFLLCDH